MPNHSAGLRAVRGKDVAQVYGVVGIAVEVVARGQPRSGRFVNHRAVAEHRQVEARTVEGDELWLKISDLPNKTLDQFFLRPLAACGAVCRLFSDESRALWPPVRSSPAEDE